jgi:hypothetical protein
VYSYETVDYLPEMLLLFSMICAGEARAECNVVNQTNQQKGSQQSIVIKLTAIIITAARCYCARRGSRRAWWCWMDCPSHSGFQAGKLQRKSP